MLEGKLWTRKTARHEVKSKLYLNKMQGDVQQCTVEKGGDNDEPPTQNIVVFIVS